MRDRSREAALLREFIREALRQGASGPGVTADPTTGTSGGARDFELERGVDIYGYWYKSPGDKGTNPGRPDSAEEYLGMSGGGGTPEEAASDLEAPPVAVAGE